MKTETVKIIPIAEFKRELARLVGEHGSISELGRTMGWVPSSIHQVLGGENMPSRKMQEHFGIEVRRVLVKKKGRK